MLIGDATSSSASDYRHCQLMVSEHLQSRRRVNTELQPVITVTWREKRGTGTVSHSTRSAGRASHLRPQGAPDRTPIGRTPPPSARGDGRSAEVTAGGAGLPGGGGARTTSAASIPIGRLVSAGGPGRVGAGRAAHTRRGTAICHSDTATPGGRRVTGPHTHIHTAQRSLVWCDAQRCHRSNAARHHTDVCKGRSGNMT